MSVSKPHSTPTTKKNCEEETQTQNPKHDYPEAFHFINPSQKLFVEQQAIFRSLILLKGVNPQ
jgi:hypothetical protein